MTAEPPKGVTNDVERDEERDEVGGRLPWLSRDTSASTRDADR
jgi:hypothetical protein